MWDGLDFCKSGAPFCKIAMQPFRPLNPFWWHLHFALRRRGIPILRHVADTNMHLTKDQIGGG